MPRLPRLSYLYPAALAYWAWNFTFGLFSSAGRLRIALLGYETPWLRAPIPSIPAEEVIGDTPQLTLFEIRRGLGSTSLLERIVLVRLAETLQPKTIFEFGTFDGQTALNLISHAPEDAHLFTLDLPASQMNETQLPLDSGDRLFIDKPVSGARFIGTPYEPRITRLYGDSATFDFSPYQGGMDLVFIDASHAYEYVRSDTLNALKLLRPSGGLIAWHDYSLTWLGVRKALNEFYRSGGPFQELRRVENTTLVILRVGANASRKT